MFVFECLLSGIVGGLFAQSAARDVDPGRLQILAGEAAGLSASGGVTPGIAVAWIVAAFVGTLVAAFAGTYLGLRGTSFAKIREEEGWREVTYRFRSSSPLRMTGQVMERLTGILGELEELGKRLRSASAGPGRRPDRSEKVRMEPAALSPASENRPSERKAPPKKRRKRERKSAPEAERTDEKKRERREVKFSRREDPREVTRRLTAGSDSEAAWRRSPSLGTFQAVRPSSSNEKTSDREAKVQRARRLLREGHDPTIVREITGLKLAELDLIGCAAEPVGVGEGTE